MVVAETPGLVYKVSAIGRSVWLRRGMPLPTAGLIEWLVARLMTACEMATTPLRAGALATTGVPARAPASADPAGSDVDDHDPGDTERDAALTRLFDRYQPQLLRLAVLLGAGEEAEDIVSEAFCELYRRWPQLRDPAAAPGYLRAIVGNRVRMHLRHLQVVRRHQLAATAAESAEAQAVLHEDQHEVVAALQRLPGRQRQALVLRYWLDLREQEVADSMGISTGAVKAHIFRGMVAMSKQLAATL